MHYTKIEKAILKLLKENEGHILSSEKIYCEVWKQVPYQCKDMVAVHICNLRRKMKNRYMEKRIETIYRKGYRWA